MALICDTSGLYALYDAADDEHEATRRRGGIRDGTLARTRGPAGRGGFFAAFSGSDPTPRSTSSRPSSKGSSRSSRSSTRTWAEPRADDPVSRPGDRAGGRHDRRRGRATASRPATQPRSAALPRHSSSRHRPLHLAAGRQRVSGHPATCLDRDDPSTNPGIDEEPPWRRGSRVPDSMVSRPSPPDRRPQRSPTPATSRIRTSVAFVEQNATPYDPDNDDYDVPAFNKAIETTKATAIYNMHVYWSKKPHTGHPAIYPPLHQARRHRARPVLRLGRDGPGRLARRAESHRHRPQPGRDLHHQEPLHARRPG